LDGRVKREGGNRTEIKKGGKEGWGGDE